MALSEKQKNNIAKLPKEDLLQILDICIEELGLVDVEDAKFALHVNRSRVYQLMKSNKIGCKNIGKHKFPMLNFRNY